MQVKKPLFVVHPFLFAIFPILSLYGHNIGQAAIADIVRSLLIGTSVTAGLLLLLWWVPRDWPRAGLAVSVALMLFFSYGHVYTFLDERFRGALFAQADVLAAMWAAGLILLPWAVLRVLPRGAARGLTPILNTVGAAALLFSSGNIAVFGWHNLRAGQIERVAAVEVQRAQPGMQAAQSGLPDIYYIILDGFGREDVLRDLYGIDAQRFQDGLRAKGFTIAEESHSNYGQTLPSLSTSLNYQYLDALLTIRPESNNRDPLEELYRQSRIEEYLKARGYEVIHVQDWFKPVQAHGKEVRIENNSPLQLNEFEIMLLKGSLTYLYLDRVGTEVYRENIRYKLRLLPELARQPGRKFVYVHLILPHPPFVFDRDGNPIGPVGSPTDGSHYIGTREGYIEGYREQVIYAGRLAGEAIDGILANAGTPPVIIVQGDHGPGAYLDHETMQNTCLRERFSILNAYYLPGKDAGLYPAITPVNTFRVVLNAYFGEDLELLPDRSFYATWSKPYAFTEVTDRLDTCTPLDAVP